MLEMGVLNMRRFNQERFNNFVLDRGVIGFFEEPVTLKSGRQSNWYVNWREATTDVFTLGVLATHVADFITDYISDYGIKAQYIYGVREGGSFFAAFTKVELAKRSPEYDFGSDKLTLRRSKPKDHGRPEDRHYIGGVPKGPTLVLEDVTTTGGSLIDEIERLRNDGVPVVAAIGLTNRMELRDDGLSVRRALARMNVPYRSLSNALDLLPLAYQKLQPGRDIADKVEAEFRQYGVEPIHLGE